jgi:diadenosine tetraphosphate (Ap4A) HIT family hydrolase
MTTSERPPEYIALGERIQRLKDAGVCYQCRDLATGEVFGDQPIVADEERIRIVLDENPKSHGHTIVVWKPHRADFSELEPHETAELFTRCTEVANAIKRGLGAEKVYLVTMCDGEPNHLHIQLIPRYPGEPIGSKRLAGPRTPIRDADATITALRTALFRQ